MQEMVTVTMVLDEPTIILFEYTISHFINLQGLQGYYL